MVDFFLTLPSSGIEPLDVRKNGSVGLSDDSKELGVGVFIGIVWSHWQN